VRIRHTAFAAVAGSALLSAAALPADAIAHPYPSDTYDTYRSDTYPGDAARHVRAGQEGSVEASALLAKASGCSQISTGSYRADARAPANIPVCGKDGVVFWEADMDIDCDGRRTSKCNEMTDPWFQGTTAFPQSDGAQLNAETLPFIVVPSAGRIWDHRASGIRGGTVAAVIYEGRVVYAVVGDTGPGEVIGEASYATAEALGINPDPRGGGVASGVTYILFKDVEVAPIESHSAAASLGDAAARRFLRDN
jgi:hypothetical protein